MNKSFCAGIALLISSPAAAATLTYNVNQTIGLGTVVGTIATNGTLGTLAQSDVTGFDLTVTGPGASVNLTQANSVIVGEGTNFSATADSLFFNYSGPSGFILFQLGSFGTGMKYFCNASVAGTCFQGASAVPESFNSPSAQVEARLGNQVLASISGTVPEPANWALMLGGFGVVGVVLRRRAAAGLPC